MKLHELLKEPYDAAMMRREGWCANVFVIRLAHRLFVGDMQHYPAFEPFTPNVEDILAEDWKFISNIPASKAVGTAIG